MNNIHILCPTTLPLKDLLTAVREIEDFIKGSSGQAGRSNEEIMRDFLQGDTKLLGQDAPPLEPAADLPEESATSNPTTTTKGVSMEYAAIVAEGTRPPNGPNDPHRST